MILLRASEILAASVVSCVLLSAHDTSGLGTSQASQRRTSATIDKTITLVTIDQTTTLVTIDQTTTLITIDKTTLVTIDQTTTLGLNNSHTAEVNILLCEFCQ